MFLLKKRYRDYVKFVRKYSDNLGHVGDYSKGEIEIINNIKLFSKCEAGAEKLMIQSGVNPKDARKRSLIGIRDENRWGVNICQPLRLPDGTYTTFVRPVSWGTLNSGIAGVVIVPQLTDGRFILLKNYRFNVTSWSIEFPRGGKDPNVSLLSMLKKELTEEMGATVISKAVRIGEIYPDSGFLASKVEIYKAKVKISGLPSHESTEAIKSLMFVSPDEFKKLIEGGKIKDGYTISAFALFNQ